jgi:formylglycine-generating enzyme required for sulfatase activity
VAQERLVSGLMNVARNPDVNPARLVEYIRDRAGLLAARGEGVYTFPHRTFQEYLAACHLTDHGFPDELADLLRADPQRWREAVLLAGAKAARGTSSAAWNLAEALCHREPPVECGEAEEADCWGALLAAQALLENEAERLGQVSERNEPKLERIRRWMLTVVTGGWLPPVDRALAGEALAVLGDGRHFDELMTVPAGPFLMGSSDADEMAGSDKKPQHEVTLPAFKVGKYPVTNARFATFVAAGGYGERRYWTDDGWEWRERREWMEAEDYGTPFNLPNHPVVGVSWYEALAYCAWLTEVWRAEGVITDDEMVRLPTEAEWEKAARGGLPPAGGGEQGGAWLWPWGDEWDETRCNTAELGLGDTCAVGMLACFQMALALTAAWIWPGRCGSGRPVCGERICSHLSSSIPMIRPMGGRTWKQETASAGCCVAGRSATFVTARAAPTATGTARPTVAGSSGFGWWSPPSLPPLHSDALHSALWGNGDLPESLEMLWIGNSSERC